ncbi:MoaD/ThiS family protein [Parapedobacter sp. 10938]|uniref:MoaD/ThiS family protein n=1 Tax=Parapedobacter flavus TaxID=3110225 RepID=UPI002DB68455|nr:MoaD/ThiS family protein [Parapedobacter sp. 10938]MEC3878223.1 MoaD/ThiS family protein [Parapedobacter sp. 10938]
MITLTFYAALKDHFPASMAVGEPLSDVRSLRTYLTDKKLTASTLLAQCRFAVADTFVDDGYTLRDGDVVLVIPPSSGG